MALSENRMIKRNLKPVMLRDYLLDDFSSCSSNGFKSFPRRQCCTTVRLLVEMDLKKSIRNSSNRILTKTKSKSATVSVFRKASVAFINAVKKFPFSSSSPVKKSPKRFLSRNFSRKLLKWRKTTDRGDGEEIRRLKSFGEFLEEKPQTSDLISYPSTVTASITTVTVTSRVDGSEIFTSVGESEMFTGADVLPSTSSNSDESNNNDLTEEKLIEEIGDITARTVDRRISDGDCEDDDDNRKEWSHEEKEQFSPVSVLDCPFEDEEETGSPLHQSHSCTKETKQKLRRIESITRLTPNEFVDQTSYKDDSLTQTSNTLEEHETQIQAREQLNLIKARIPSNSSVLSKSDDLLLDFFGEKITENYKEDSLQVAEDWINGRSKELFLGWEVKEHRVVYVKDLEKNGRWRDFDEEKEMMTKELEAEFYTCLVEELLLDLLY